MKDRTLNSEFEGNKESNVKIELFERLCNNCGDITNQTLVKEFKCENGYNGCIYKCTICENLNEYSGFE